MLNGGWANVMMSKGQHLRLELWKSMHLKKGEEAGQRKSYEKGRWGFVQQNMIDRIAQISSSFAVNCSRIYP